MFGPSRTSMPRAASAWERRDQLVRARPVHRLGRGRRVRRHLRAASGVTVFWILSEAARAHRRVSVSPGTVSPSPCAPGRSVLPRRPSPRGARPNAGGRASCRARDRARVCTRRTEMSAATAPVRPSPSFNRRHARGRPFGRRRSTRGDSSSWLERPSSTPSPRSVWPSRASRASPAAVGSTTTKSGPTSRGRPWAADESARCSAAGLTNRPRATQAGDKGRAGAVVILLVNSAVISPGSWWSRPALRRKRLVGIHVQGIDADVCAQGRIKQCVTPPTWLTRGDPL